jgi:hypothetical protein
VLIEAFDAPDEMTIALVQGGAEARSDSFCAVAESAG